MKNSLKNLIKMASIFEKKLNKIASLEPLNNATLEQRFLSQNDLIPTNETHPVAQVLLNFASKTKSPEGSIEIRLSAEPENRHTIGDDNNQKIREYEDALKKYKENPMEGEPQKPILEVYSCKPHITTTIKGKTTVSKELESRYLNKIKSIIDYAVNSGKSNPPQEDIALQWFTWQT